MDLADLRRRVGTTCAYLPGAVPTHPLPVMTTPDVRAEEEDRMDLHRAVLRGKGFYDWMTRPVPALDVADAMASLKLDAAPAFVRPLPVVNLLDVGDAEYADALIHEALPDDRVPFRQYLTARPLGIGIITAVSSPSTSEI